jgi:GNAT superfamily N-acetyltransferase
MFTRVWNRLRSDGLPATVRALAHRLRKLAYVSEEHVWYQCDLDETRPRRDLPQEVRLVRAELSQVGNVARLGQDPEEARRRIEEGNDAWLVVDGDEPLFACYSFRHSAPVLAASHGKLTLPPGAACIEDSVAAPAARGRGIGPGAWTLIGDELSRDGFTALVTKIETANTPSRRAAEKVGFRPVAVMHHQRTGVRRRTAVRPLGSGLGDELAARLS